MVAQQLQNLSDSDLMLIETILSKEFAKENKIEEFNHIKFSHLLTVCDHANESCPIYLKNAVHCHENFKDPSKMNGPENFIKDCYRNCRNEIEQFVLPYLKGIFIE